MKILSLVWDKPERRDSLDNFLKKSFKKIKDDAVPYLIIDIRNNTGGSSVLAKDIFDYITDHRLKISWEEDYFDKGKLVRDTAFAWYIPKNMADKFNGKTILLTNTLTGSAAHMMAASFKYYHLGILVGQVSGELLFIPGQDRKQVLPHTNCVLSYATANFKLPGYHEGKKEYLIPDYEVYPDLQSAINNKDTMLNFAVKLFGKTF